MKKDIRQETAIKIANILEDISDVDVELMFAIFMEMAKSINRIDQWGILRDAEKQIEDQLDELRKENKR